MANTSGQPPYNREAEEALIGSLLIDPDAVHRARETELAASDFYMERLGMVYDAAIALSVRREPVDLVTIADELERRGQLREVGGSSELTRLVSVTPSSIYAQSYAEVILRCARQRRLIQASGEIAQLAYEHEGNLDELYDGVTQALFGAITRTANGAHLTGGKSAIGWYERQQAEMRERLAANPNALIYTHWRDVDAIVGDIQPGQLVIIGANTSVGKTMAMEQIAEANAQRGHKVVYYHFEISHRGMLHRTAARHSGVDSRRLRQGYFGPEVARAMDSIAEWFGNITLVHSPGWSAERVAADITRMHARGECDLAVVDYLQKVRMPDKPGLSSYKLTGAACETLKNCAEDLGIPLVLGSQTNREYKRSGRGRPIMADLRDSGEIEEKANVVLMLHNPVAPEERRAEDETEIIECYIEKSTDGPVGMAKLVHRKGRFLLGDLVREGQEEPEWMRTLPTVEEIPF